MTIRPGLLTRLTYLIVIQMLFVFAAICLMLFYAGPERTMQPVSELDRAMYGELSAKIAASLADVPDSDLGSLDSISRIALSGLFATSDYIDFARLYISGDGGRVQSIHSFSSPGRFEDAGHENVSGYINEETVRFQIDQAPSGLIAPVYTSRHALHYYRFDLRAGVPAVLAILSDHGFLVSNRSRLQYAMVLLFLVCTLISLLIGYLLSKGFTAPLKRLTYGIVKTTEGEHYHLMSTGGDREIQTIESAFNQMTRTLYDDNQRIKKYVNRLNTGNRLLLESQQFLGTLIDSTPSGVVTVSASGEVVVFNAKASELFGYSSDEILGGQVATLFSHSAADSQPTQNPTDGSGGFEVLCQRKDGSIFPAYVIASLLELPGGEFPASLMIFKDISESKSFQEMMIRIDRYYTRGEMVGDIAHEINNYLAILSGNIELMPLMLKKGDQEKIDKKLLVMRTTCERISRFADGLLDRDPDDIDFHQADLNQLVENLTAFLRPQNRFDGITLSTDLSPELSLVELDIGLIQQVLINLIQNAADSVKELPEDRQALVRTMLIPGQGSERKVRIEVRDNGPGVPDTLHNKLFVERFSTKRKRNGFGLVTCRKIVDAHHGSIGYEHQDETVFHVELPVAQPTTQSSGKSIQQAAPVS